MITSTLKAMASASIRAPVKKGDYIRCTVSPSGSTSFSIDPADSASSSKRCRFEWYAPSDGWVSVDKAVPSFSPILSKAHAKKPAKLQTSMLKPGDFAMFTFEQAVLSTRSFVVPDGKADSDTDPDDPEYTPSQLVERTGIFWVQEIKQNDALGYWLRDRDEFSQVQLNKFEQGCCKRTGINWSAVFTDEYSIVPLEDFEGLAKWDDNRDKIRWKNEKGKSICFPRLSDPQNIHMLCVESEDACIDMTWTKMKDIAQAQQRVYSQDKSQDNDKDAAVRAATPLVSLADLRNLHHSYF